MHLVMMLRAAFVGSLLAAVFGAKKSSSPNSSPTAKPNSSPTRKPTSKPTAGWQPYCRDGLCSSRCSCYGSCYNRCVSCRCNKHSWEVYGTVSLTHFKCLTEDHRTAVRYAVADQLGVARNNVGLHSVTAECAADVVSYGSRRLSSSDILGEASDVQNVMYELSDLTASTSNTKLDAVNSMSNNPSGLFSHIHSQIDYINPNGMLTHNDSMVVTASTGTRSQYNHDGSVNAATRGRGSMPRAALFLALAAATALASVLN